MRFLFTIQGEGRGHYTQALALATILRKNGHEVVAVLVGTSDSAKIPQFFSDKIGLPLHKFGSPNFASFYNQRRPNILLSILKNAARPFIFRKSIKFVAETIRELKPDMVINFYEMITGMAYQFYKFDKHLSIPMVAIAHQYLLLNSNYKTTAEQDMKYYLLRMLSQLTSRRAAKVLALSFRDVPTSGRVVSVPPLLREEVFEIEPTEGDYIHGYMANIGFYNEVTTWHEKNLDVPLRFFWDNRDAADVTNVDDNYVMYRLCDDRFLRSMAGCRAYATTAGFESVCEALYWRKPILMVPVHIEQEFNLFDAKLSGAGIGAKKFNLTNLIDFIPHYAPDQNFNEWVDQAEERFIKEICG